MGNKNKTYGVKIRVPSIYETRESWSTQLKVNKKVLFDRPKTVVKQFIHTLIDAKLVSKDIIYDIFFYGVDKGLWNTDDLYQMIGIQMRRDMGVPYDGEEIPETRGSQSRIFNL